MRGRAHRLVSGGATLAAALLLAAVGPPASAAPPVGGYSRTLLTVGAPDVPSPFIPSTTGNPVNGAGLVAGSATIYGFRSPTDAGVYNLTTGTWTDLGTFGSSNEARAADVNEGGDVVGAAGTDIGSGSPTRAFLWTPERPTLLDLGSLDPLDRQSGATAVNDHGVVVGWTYTPDSGYTGHAFLWDPKASPLGMRDLGTLGGVDSVAYGINNAGTVVGSATTRRRVVRPFVWTPAAHAMVDIGTLPGYDSGVARDVNDRGYVVGEDFNAATPDDTRAFLWNPVTHAVTALNAPAGQASRAYAINHYGVIVGRVDYPPIEGSSSPDSKVAIWRGCTPLTVLPEDYATATGITRRERIVGTSIDGGASWLKAGPCT